MRSKKIMAVALAAAMATGTLVAPASQLEAKAAAGFVSVNNQASGISSVSFHTPEDTLRQYAGLSWEELDMKMKLRLNVTDSECGPLARKALGDKAYFLGAEEVKFLDMDLEKCLGNSGWTQDVERTYAPIRVSIALPKDSDPKKDYAVISLKEAGEVDVLGDLDADPKTVTVDSDYFDTFLIASAPAGTFDRYRQVDSVAVESLELPIYVKKIGSTVNILGDHPMGVLTDEAEARAAVGGKALSLGISGITPGVNAMYALDSAVKGTNAENKRRAGKKADGSDEVVPGYSEMNLLVGAGVRATSTNGKLRITIGVPYSFPVYADYAVAVLNMDGTVTIMKDIDENPCTVTIDTDQFRTYMFLWGKKGAFDSIGQ